MTLCLLLTLIYRAHAFMCIWTRIAAGVFFVLTILFALPVIVFIIAGMFGPRFYRFVNWAKGFLLVSNLWMIIGVVLYPIGFAWLDDTCIPGDVHCGLSCTGDRNMGFFSLCHPWDLG